MNSTTKIYLLIVGLLLSGACSTANAQIADSSAVVTARSVVESVRSAHQRLEYDTAESQALEALSHFERFSSDQLVELNVILALINYARNDTPGARRFFLSALSLNPDLALDPLLVSPKTLSFFGEVKSDSEQSRAGNSGTESGVVRYLVLQDARPEAALRSMIAPGWGHVRLNRGSKGKILLGAWAIAATGTLASYIVAEGAKTDYLDETNPDRVRDRFDRYNGWHRARNGFAVGAAAVWIYSLFDILLSGPATPRPYKSSRLNLDAGPGVLGLEIRF